MQELSEIKDISFIINKKGPTVFLQFRIRYLGKTSPTYIVELRETMRANSLVKINIVLMLIPGLPLI